LSDDRRKCANIFVNDLELVLKTFGTFASIVFDFKYRSFMITLITYPEESNTFSLTPIAVIAWEPISKKLAITDSTSSCVSPTQKSQ
jgi:hypothetical protein